MKKGILIVSFGTTYRETREKNIERIAETVREANPDCAVYQAYSSDKVGAILRKRDGIVIPGIEEALKQMSESGVSHLTVLPTHIIDGIENNKLKRIVKESSSCFNTEKIAGALLEKEEDYFLTAKALWEELRDLVGDSVLILMGHGSYHEADSSYEKMESALREYSGKEIYIATVEGSTAIEDVISRMNAIYERKQDRRKIHVIITPFMLVAGDHAVNDMAGEENSFLSKVTAEGYDAECILKGLGEYEGIREIYMRHLREAGRI